MTVYMLNGVSPACPDDAEFWVAPGAHVIGNVSIGRGVSIWFGAVIRGDNEPVVLGDGTNVQDNAVLHTDPGFPLEIGAQCTIGHAAIVHGCTIGDRSLVGMGGNGSQWRRCRTELPGWCKRARAGRRLHSGRFACPRGAGPGHSRTLARGSLRPGSCGLPLQGEISASTGNLWVNWFRANEVQTSVRSDAPVWRMRDCRT